jgi:hypothetical protein
MRRVDLYLTHDVVVEMPKSIKQSDRQSRITCRWTGALSTSSDCLDNSATSPPASLTHTTSNYLDSSYKRLPRGISKRFPVASASNTTPEFQREPRLTPAPIEHPRKYRALGLDTIKTAKTPHHYISSSPTKQETQKCSTIKETLTNSLSSSPCPSA